MAEAPLGIADNGFTDGLWCCYSLAMKRGAQVAFVFSVLFLCFFLFGITDVGQAVLRGRIPPNADHWQADDIYMGAGLAPWVYGLAPSAFLAALGSGLVVGHRLKVP